MFVRRGAFEDVATLVVVVELDEPPPPPLEPMFKRVAPSPSESLIVNAGKVVDQEVALGGGQLVPNNLPN